MGVVYLARCLATGKVYVGCTSKSLQQRKEEHIRDAVNGSPFRFHEAIRKMGAGQFTWKVLATEPDPSALFKLEAFYVSKYNSYRNGYNSTPGGKGSPDDGMKVRYRAPSAYRRR